MIYKIFRSAEWEALQADGQTSGAPIDVEDGYIHFSGPRQVPETAAKHFAGETDLVLISVDETTLGKALKWEKARNEQLFPHLYRKLLLADVVAVHKIGHDGKSHVFPDVIPTSATRG